MDIKLAGSHYTYRIVKAPALLEDSIKGDVQDLVRRRIPEVGFVVAEQALDGYTNYPLMTLAYEQGKLVGYHGASVRPAGKRWLINLGSLYLEPGLKRHLGQALMALSVLPVVLSRPHWPVVYYTLTRSPRVVAAGHRWMRPFYPDLTGHQQPDSTLLQIVEEDLHRRGEGLIPGAGLVLGPPAGGWTSIPLPKHAWSGQSSIDDYVRESLGPLGDRRLLVLGEVTVAGILRIALRGLAGKDHMQTLNKWLRLRPSP